MSSGDDWATQSRYKAEAEARIAESKVQTAGMDMENAERERQKQLKEVPYTTALAIIGKAFGIHLVWAGALVWVTYIICVLCKGWN